VYIEPARLITESYTRTEGEPIILRQAKAFRHLVHHMTIAIHPNELVVGNRSPLPRMGVITPSAAVGWIDEELDTLPTRPWDPFDVQPSEIRELREDIFSYWTGTTLEDRVASAIPRDVQEARECRLFTLHQTDHAQGHIIPNVERWLQRGPSLLKADAIRARDRLSQEGSLTQEQADFYDAAIICLEAASDFMSRYGVLALELAGEERCSKRRRELTHIGRNCQQVAKSAPQGFWQALQSVWFLWTLLEIESNASAFSPGRVDQYLNPFLLHDLREGYLTLEDAQELLDCLWIKFNEVVLLRRADSARYFAGFPIGFNLVVGGQTPQGQDATNELSFMCLQAQADVGLPQPSLGVRVHQNSPQDLLTAAARVISMGSGMPQVFNDEAVLPALQNRGVDDHDALNYAIVGCVEPAAPGKTLGWNNAAMLNLVRVLELTLYGGQDCGTGRQVGPATGRLEHVPTFPDFEVAYQQQLRHAIALMVKGVNAVDVQHPQSFPTPFASTVIDDCLAVGRDVTAGGAHYNFTGVQGVQIANLADSLAALRSMVYERKEVSPEQLLAALQQDFDGHERLRQRLLCRVPKYGNDDSDVDALARKWARFFCEEVSRHRNPRGGTYQAGFYTLAAHVPQGKNVGATPDGRLATCFQRHATQSQVPSLNV
jgi:pyruvate formate-lyase/glycerol dehydratase family glycyl radical enzyme